MTAAALTLAEFLLARIAEDEADARLGERENIPADCWAPERILRECEAKRRIVERHDVPPPLPTRHPSQQNMCYEDADDMPCPTLRLLALPYADHPDYLDDWRP